MTQTNIQYFFVPIAAPPEVYALPLLVALPICGWDRNFKSHLKPESSKSGRGLLPGMNSHVAPLSEPIHDPNQHTRALRTNGSHYNVTLVIPGGRVVC